MQSRQAPVFGKRPATAAPRRVAAALPLPVPFIPAPVIPPDRDDEIGLRMVPRSPVAAILAGLVTGFFLAGLDITHAAAPDPVLAPLLHLGGLGDRTAAAALPAMIVLSLFSGARIAAMTLLLAHRFLHWAGQSGHAAYAVGGAAVTAAYAALLLAFGHPPSHGWVIDIAAGAAAGFFYRMFAGARPVRQDL